MKPISFNKLLAILTDGAATSDNSLTRYVHGGKHSDQKTKKQSLNKADRTKKRKRLQQKASRKKNRNRK